MTPEAARAHLEAARAARGTSARRAQAPGWYIAAFSVFGAIQVIAPAYPPVGYVVMIAALVAFLAVFVALFRRRDHRPASGRYGTGSVLLVLLAVLTIVGGVLGSRAVLASNASISLCWVIGVIVAIVVAVCVAGANALYRRRSEGVASR